ncbi:MAG TPA: amidohydrolase family protein [Actinoplanes sp.]
MTHADRQNEALHLRATVLPDGDVRDVFVVGGRITFTVADDARTVFDGGYLVPGLVDAHAHLSLFSPAGDGASPPARVRASARAQLDAGVLAVREPGSPDYASQELGPAIGLPWTVTGGHLLAAPGRYFPGLGREITPDELPAAAAEEVAASGAWCKVIADFFAPGGAITPAFPADALAEAARVVHAAGGKITAHATVPEVIDAVLAAGFDAIEHGTLMRPDQLDALVASGAALVPTLMIGAGILGAVRGFGGDDTAVERMRRGLAGQGDVVRAAAKRGVPVLAGTDAGMGPHGQVATEIAMLLRAGLGPAAALGAGSWNARRYLGLPGIDEGAPADLVGYRDDPRQDVEELRRPAFVLLHGQRVR